MIQQRIERLNKVDEIDAILDYGSRSNSYSNSRLSHRKSMDSGGWDFEVMTLKKNASVSSYDEHGYSLDNSTGGGGGGSGKLHLRREVSYNSLKSSKSSSHSTPTPSWSGNPSSSSASSSGGSVTAAATAAALGTNSYHHRKLQIRNALMRAESDLQIGAGSSGERDDGCKESKYVTNIRLEGMILSADHRLGESEVKQDAKEPPFAASSSFSFSPTVTPRSGGGMTTTPSLSSSSDLYGALQCLQKVLERNQRVCPSELYHGVLEPTLNELETLTDEMKGDSEATRKETKVLIGLLKQILIALDKHTDSGLISSFISTVIGFAMDDEEGEEDQEEEEDAGEQDQL
jgi:hypothetical protein